MTKDPEMQMLEELSQRARVGARGGVLTAREPEVILAEMPRRTREQMEQDQQAYVARLEAKLENCIEVSPTNAKLIIQFLEKPVEGEDWEVDATIDLLWKELERQAAKA